MEFFQDGNGSLSAMRLSQHMIIATTLFLWINACWHSNWTLLPLDNTHILLISIALSAKVVQTFSENK